jgi:hypothetical protein
MATSEGIRRCWQLLAACLLSSACMLWSACSFDGAGLSSSEAGVDVALDGPLAEQPSSLEAGVDLDSGSVLDGSEGPPPDISVPDTTPTTTPPYRVSAEGWALRAPLLGNVRVEAIWSTASRDVWAVGEKGLVLHYNGAGWRSVTVPTSEDLFGVWGSAPDDVWFVGAKGTALHFDGQAITAVTLPTTETLLAIHGTASQDIWVVGEKGVILHYDGTWAQRGSGLTFDLLGVYAASTSEVWAAGKDKQALFFDGTQWSPEVSEATDWRRGVFARSRNDAWLAATRGVSHYDGIAWTKTGKQPPMPTYVYAVHGDSSAIWAVGDSKVLRRAGPEWAEVHDFGGSVSLLTVHRGDGATFAGGYGGWLAQEVGATWSRIVALPTYLLAIAGGGGKLWFCGSNSYVAVEDGRGFRRIGWQTKHNSAVTGVWVDASGVAWVVTADGRIARYDKGKDLLVQQHDHHKALKAIWGAGPNAIWAVGADGGLFFSTGDGSWTAQPGAGKHAWRGIWGSSASDVYVVGGWGKVSHFNGTTWSPRAVGGLTPEVINAVHGRSSKDIWLVGDKGLVWHFDGKSWSADSRGGMNLNTTLSGVYVAPSGKVWITAAGDAAVYHASPGDSAWQTHLIDVGVGGYPLQAIWGAGEQDIWTVGDKGNLRHYEP